MRKRAASSQRQAPQQAGGIGDGRCPCQATGHHREEACLAARCPHLRSARLPVLLAASPALAKVLAEGKPSPGGFHWQKVEASNGKVSDLCRKKGVGQMQKPAACNGAKAVKP